MTNISKNKQQAKKIHKNDGITAMHSALPDKNKAKFNFIAAGYGTTFTSMLLAGIVVGYAFDYVFNSLPIMLISTTFIGFIGGLLKVHHISVNEAKLEISKKKDKNTKKQ